MVRPQEALEAEAERDMAGPRPQHQHHVLWRAASASSWRTSSAATWAAPLAVPLPSARQARPRMPLCFETLQVLYDIRQSSAPLQALVSDHEGMHGRIIGRWPYRLLRGQRPLHKLQG